MTDTKINVVAIEYKKDTAGRSEITDILRANTTLTALKTLINELGDTVVRRGNLYDYYDKTNDRYYSIHNNEMSNA